MLICMMRLSQRSRVQIYLQNLLINLLLILWEDDFSLRYEKKDHKLLLCCELSLQSIVAFVHLILKCLNASIIPSCGRCCKEGSTIFVFSLWMTACRQTWIWFWLKKKKRIRNPNTLMYQIRGKVLRCFDYDIFLLCSCIWNLNLAAYRISFQLPD